MPVDDDLWVVVALAPVGPLHASQEVVELVGIEAPLIANAGGAYRLRPAAPGRGERVGATSALVVACPSGLPRVLGVVQTVGHDEEHARRVALHTPFVGGVFLPQGTASLYAVLVLLPVLLAEFALFLPCALVPDELQVVSEVLAQPLVRTVGEVHAHFVFHVLVGDGEEPELADEVSHFIVAPCLLHPPDGLRQRIGPSPCRHVDGAFVGFVGQLYQQIASLGIISLANNLDAAVPTAHHGTAPDVFDAWPVADELSVLFLHRHKRRLSRPPHQLRQILAVSFNDAVQILCPLRRIGVAVPAYRRDDGLHLEHVGVGHQPDHRLHVVGFDVSRGDVCTYHEPRFQLVLLL